MAKPIYSRLFDDACLPASQVINDSDDSDDDFHARLSLRKPKQIVRKLKPRTEATSPVLSKSKRTLEWENLARPNINVLIDQSLRKEKVASTKIRSENNRGDHKSTVKKQKTSTRKTNVNIKSKVNSTTKQPLSVQKKNILTPKENPCKTPKQNTVPVNKTASLVTPFFDVSKINTIENKNDETPSSPILSSKNRSKNTSKISTKLLLPPDSDETEDEFTSPVFSKKRKFAAKESFDPDHTSVRRKLIKSVNENDELEILNTGENLHINESTKGKDSMKKLLSDSFSDFDIIEASDNEAEKQNKSKRKSGSLEKKIVDRKIVDNESDLNDTLLPAQIVDDTETELDDTVPIETDVIPESPCTPASQVINSDEEFPFDENEAPKSNAISRFVFDDDAEEEVDENSVAALLATESKVSISSVGSILASNPSNTSLDQYQALTDHEKGLLEDIMKSAKKRKPVVGGLRKRLEKAVQMNNSMRAIRCHQIRELNDKPKNFLLLKITNLKISYLSACKISGYDVRTKKEYFLFLNSDICPKVLKLNDTIRILPPWSIVPKQGKNMIVGVLQFDIMSVKEIKELIGDANHINDDVTTISVDKDDTKSEKIIDMRCDCVASGKGTLCCDYDGAPCHSLIKYLNILQGSASSKRSCKRSAKLPSAFLHRIASYPKREVESVSDLVKRFGGICVTPDSQSLSNSTPSILEVRILQPLLQYKNYGIYKDKDIGFIAEDKTGQFIIIKLDSDVVDSPAQWKKFTDNAWNELVGSIIRISSLFPHSRMLTNRSSRLTKLLSMFHRPKQTYIYTFKVFPCSHYQIVRRNLENLADPQLPDIYDLSYPLNFRIQMKCIVVHSVEDRERYILVHSQKHFTPNFIKIYHSKEAIIPTLDECPALVSLYGLYQESADKFILDHYSACVLIEKRIQFPYRDTITAELPDSFICRAELPEELSPNSYQLVRLNGKISEVCVDDCIQWLDCGECWSKEILDLEEERLCNICQASFIRNNIKLVVNLCNQKVHLLQSTAFKLLTNNYGSIELHEAGHNVEDSTEDDLQSRLLLYDSSLQPSLVTGKMVDILVFKLSKESVWTQIPS